MRASRFCCIGYRRAGFECMLAFSAIRPANNRICRKIFGERAVFSLNCFSFAHVFRDKLLNVYIGKKCGRKIVSTRHCVGHTPVEHFCSNDVFLLFLPAHTRIHVLTSHLYYSILGCFFQLFDRLHAPEPRNARAARVRGKPRRFGDVLVAVFQRVDVRLCLAPRLDFVFARCAKCAEDSDKQEYTARDKAPVGNGHAVFRENVEQNQKFHFCLLKKNRPAAVVCII